MTPIVLWVVLACGVDAGYEPAPDGHLEYIIQIEPQLVASLASGHNVTSEVPRGLDVRHYRLTVGSAALPHIAATAVGGQTVAAGGTAARPADAFEAPGRADEAIGATTPQVRVGYELISATSGQYVLEIDPRSLGDLNQSDFTGDIPPGLPVTRFVISTNPGTAPSGKPSGTEPPLAAATPTVPSLAGTGPGSGEDDPSVWEPEKPTAAPGSPQNSGGAQPSSPSSALPDDPPDGAVQPPPAMPARPTTREEPSHPAGAGGPAYVDPPGGILHEKGFDAGDGNGTKNDTPAPPPEASAPLSAVPARFPVESTAQPLAALTSGVGEAESDGGERGVRKPDAAAAASGEKSGDSAAAGEKSEKRELPPTKPWLPLLVTTCVLLFSMGLNVFLGWIAWESYNRGQTVTAKLENRKPSLSS